MYIWGWSLAARPLRNAGQSVARSNSSSNNDNDNDNDDNSTHTTIDNNTNNHCPKYDDNVSFQGLLKFAPT